MSNIKINGTVASEGAEQIESIAGVAKLVFSKEDIDKVQFGDVIVMDRLTPEFAAVLKKAKAIITEIGGAGSHAVLLSREHGLPCIMDVIDATVMLKDGDLVELNVKKATVRRIDRLEFDLLLQNEKDMLHKEVDETEEKIKEVTEKELVTKPYPVLWFNVVNKNDIGIVGGKGASLGEMFSKFPIPNGFCISAQAYEKEVENIIQQIHKVLKIDINDSEALAKASKDIEKMILALDMGNELKVEIVKNYEKLCSDANGGFVAVRSSATAEDLPEASFAGQQATLLNVKGSKALLKAVKECWASLFTERAIYYREINNFKHEDVLISVVVQEMVDSEKAGVMFTVNPVTKNYDEVLIEGNFGLGETVVSGEVTPDSYFIDKNTYKINQKHVSEKTWGLFRGVDSETNQVGNVKKQVDDIPGIEPNDQLLSDEDLKELTEIGKNIEKHYDKPMDIEWAWYKGKFYILQARPITTL
ncbi:MAG: PEP/pyruvate-binding domain-containing protein [Candidatus Woesearchaeota archaeon]